MLKVSRAQTQEESDQTYKITSSRVQNIKRIAKDQMGRREGRLLGFGWEQIVTPSAPRAKLSPKLSCPKLTGLCLDPPAFLCGDCTYTDNRIDFLPGSFGSKGQIVSEGNTDQFPCTSWQLPDKWLPGSCHSAAFTSQISYLNPLTRVQVLRCDIVRGHSVGTSTFTLTC